MNEANQALDRETMHPLSLQVPVEQGLTRQILAPRHLLDPALIIAPHASPASAHNYREAAANIFPTDPFDAPPSNSRQRSANRRIFVTSPHQRDGKTCSAFNLAWTLAQSDKTVLLAELNFVHPHLCTALGDLRLRYGLENALSGTALAADAVFAVDSTSLYIAAVRDAIPASNLAPVQENLDAFLTWASQNFDLLVLDCPSVLSREWNQWFRRSVHSALLVIRENHTPQIEIQRAAKSLGPALTSVLVNATRQVPAQRAAQPQSWRISPPEELRPTFLQTDHMEVATASERKH